MHRVHLRETDSTLIRLFGLVRPKYDRSGRSSGVAVISFETPVQATRAKKQFEGILAKGKFAFSLCGSTVLVVSFGNPCLRLSYPRSTDVNCI